MIYLILFWFVIFGGVYLAAGFISTIAMLWCWPRDDVPIWKIVLLWPAFWRWSALPLPPWPFATYVIFAAVALIATGFVMLAGWPASIIVAGILLLAMTAFGLFG